MDKQLRCFFLQIFWIQTVKKQTVFFEVKVYNDSTAESRINSIKKEIQTRIYMVRN